jgi:hypothetical protein
VRSRLQIIFDEQHAAKKRWHVGCPLE